MVKLKFQFHELTISWNNIMENFKFTVELKRAIVLFSFLPISSPKRFFLCQLLPTAISSFIFLLKWIEERFQLAAKKRIWHFLHGNWTFIFIPLKISFLKTLINAMYTVVCVLCETHYFPFSTLNNFPSAKMGKTVARVL